MQEFLAAYHIARNANLIDDVIFGYLTRHKGAYLDISQVFIFLCGLNISAANKLSGMMDEQNAKMMGYSASRFWSYRYIPFQNIIKAGYREAVSNEQTGILLRLSHFKVFHEHENNLRDINNIWTDNTTNVMAFESIKDSDIHSSPAHNEPTSHVEFNLSTCLKLKSLTLNGSGIRLQESGSSMSSEFPIWIVLNSADQAQCEDPPPVLPCIENITLNNVTCSSTCLRSLFSILLTLDHKIKCELWNCTITPCIEDAVRGSDTKTDAKIKCFKNTSNMLDIENESPGLWEALHGLNIKSLSLSGRLYVGFKVNHAESMSQALPSLAHLETLSIKVDNDSPGLWEALRGLNIKSLSLIGGFGGLKVSHPESLSQALSSLKHLATLSIKMNFYNPGIWGALHGLNIKSLSLSGGFGSFSVNHPESMSQSLLSLEHLETLSIEGVNVIRGTWKALHGLNIKSLSLSGVDWSGGLKVNHPESMSQSLLSLKHLATLKVNNYDPGLWNALHSLNIKSLSLSGGFRDWNVNHSGSISQSLSSLEHLETLKVNNYTPGLWNALHSLNIKSLSLSGEFGGWNVNHPGSISQSLSSLEHLETLSIEEGDSPGLMEALQGLNIKSLSLSEGRYGFRVFDAESLSRLLLSLKQLETLSVYVRTYIDIQLPQLLKCLHIYCMTLLPSELRKLVNTLSAYTRTVESKLEFGCGSFDGLRLTPIPPEEYMPIKLELETLKNVAVKRFRIRENNMYIGYHGESAWSVRDIGAVDDDNQDDDNVKDDAYERFVIGMDNTIINRISIRLLITPASNS